MQLYPFFIECSKYYNNQPYKKKILEQFAFGNGALIFKKNKKDVLITSEGEFIIPSIYSDESRMELENKIWKNDEFFKMQNIIKEYRNLWVNIKKKDKLYLIYQYIASLNLEYKDKILASNLIKFLLFLKILSNSNDIEYDNYKITKINENLFKNKYYKNLL